MKRVFEQTIRDHRVVGFHVGFRDPLVLGVERHVHAEPRRCAAIQVVFQPRSLHFLPPALRVLSPADFAFLEAVVLEVAEEDLLFPGMRLVRREHHHARDDADLGVEEELVGHGADRFQSVAAQQFALAVDDSAVLCEGRLHRHDGDAGGARIETAQIAGDELQLLDVALLVRLVRRIEQADRGLEAGNALDRLFVEAVAVKDVRLAVLMDEHVGHRQRIDIRLQLDAVQLLPLDAALDALVASRIRHHLFHRADQEAACAGAAVVYDRLGVDSRQVREQFGDVRRREDDSQPLVAVRMTQELDVERAQHVAVLVRLAEGVHVAVDAVDDLPELVALGGKNGRGRKKSKTLPNHGEGRIINAGVAQALHRDIHGHLRQRLRLAFGTIGFLERWTLQRDEYGADEKRAIPFRHLVDMKRVVELRDERLQGREVLPVLGVVVAASGDVLFRRQQFTASLA